MDINTLEKELEQYKNSDKFYFELTIKEFYETKAKEDSKEKNWYIEGFIATTDQDTEDDIIKEDALRKAAQILKEKYNTVLYNHDRNRAIGRVIDAQVKDTPWGSKGLWVKILISKTEIEIWQKIQEGVLSKFSIGAFAVREPVYVTNENGEKVVDHYEIIDLFPFECSLVSIPANPNAVALNYYVSKFLKVKEDGKTTSEKGAVINKATPVFSGDKPEAIIPLEKEVNKMAQNIKKEEKKKPKITINRHKVDFKPWSQVNKIRIGQILAESGNTSAIKEAFGVVPDVKKRSTWKFPHHVLVSTGENSYELRLSYPGVMAAYKAFRGARNKPKLTSEQASQLKSHLRKHFRQLIEMDIYDEMPEGLKSLKEVLPIIEKDLNDKELSQEEEQLLTKELLEKSIDETDIIEDDWIFYDSEELEEVEKGKKKEDNSNDDNDSQEDNIELDENTFFEKIKEIVREVVSEVLSEFLGKNKEKSLETHKNLEKSEEDLDMAEDVKKNETLEKDLDKKVEDKKEDIQEVNKDKEIIEALTKTIEDLKKEVDSLKKELEEVKQEPVTKGKDSQRGEEEDFDIRKFINSEEFEKAPLEKKLDVLKVLMQAKQ